MARVDRDVSPGFPGLVTVGHGTLSAERFAGLVSGAEVGSIVDVRRYPGSRRHPHFARAAMEEWLSGAGVSYSWDPSLGGFRKPRADSTNLALRHPSFRGYADYMDDPEFHEGLERLLDRVRQRHAEDGSIVAIMCSEALWWRCHRRLISDWLVLCEGCEVRHLLPDGRLDSHRPTDGARLIPGSGLVYDVGQATRLDL